MTTPAARASKVLRALRKSYTITCEICGRVVVRKGHPKARTCGRNACRYQLRKRRKGAEQ